MNSRERKKGGMNRIWKSKKREVERGRRRKPYKTETISEKKAEIYDKL